jgi:hypothetical protein
VHHPEICPILTLAVYVFAKGMQRDGSNMLFGENSEKRFSQWLHNVCSSNEQEILNMGVYISEIGTHSFRKGVSTYLGSQPGGPSPISVFLRAGWSLGRVQSRYIFENEGGDQFVGRAATGLPLTDIKFASLPPHFISEQILTTAQWEEILPGYSNFYPVQFRTALPYLLASLVYHRNYIRQNYATTHPYFLTRLWRSNLLEQLASQVHVGIGINSVTSMEATGIPPYTYTTRTANGWIGTINSKANYCYLWKI